MDVADIAQQGLESKIQRGEIICQNPDCDSREHDVETWMNKQGDPVGAAICHKCNTRMEIQIDDSQLDEAMEEIMDAFEDALS